MNFTPVSNGKLGIHILNIVHAFQPHTNNTASQAGTSWLLIMFAWRSQVEGERVTWQHSKPCNPGDVRPSVPLSHPLLTHPPKEPIYPPSSLGLLDRQPNSFITGLILTGRRWIGSSGVTLRPVGSFRIMLSHSLKTNVCVFAGRLFVWTLSGSHLQKDKGVWKEESMINHSS